MVMSEFGVMTLIVNDLKVFSKLHKLYLNSILHIQFLGLLTKAVCVVFGFRVR